MRVDVDDHQNIPFVLARIIGVSFESALYQVCRAIGRSVNLLPPDDVAHGTGGVLISAHHSDLHRRGDLEVAA
jgi:hypothetical protein